MIDLTGDSSSSFMLTSIPHWLMSHVSTDLIDFSFYLAVIFKGLVLSKEIDNKEQLLNT